MLRLNSREQIGPFVLHGVGSHVSSSASSDANTKVMSSKRRRLTQGLNYDSMQRNFVEGDC